MSSSVSLDTYLFTDDGGIPNSRLPVLVLRDVAAAREAAACERLFAANGWRRAWRDGIYLVSPFPLHRA